MSTHQYQLIATGVLLEFKLANCQQWVKATTDEVITLPIAFSKIKFVVLGTCATSEWVYENVSVLNDSDLSTVIAWSASENQAGKITKPKNIIAMGI